MRLLPTIAIAALLALPAAQANAAPASPPIITRAVDGFVRPAYAAFHASTTTLKAAIGALCASPSEQALDAAHNAFAATAAAWSAAEIIRFGPVTEQNRLERILFWPDRKSTGLKQVQAALAQQDATATDAATLAGKSVAMQGLGALEFILFGTGAEALSTSSEAYRCAYGAAVAANLDTMATAIAREWDAGDGIAAAWETPRADNPFYRDDAEALGELFDVFVNGLELVRDVRINGFLGQEAADDKPRQALFWRSGQTVAALAANMEGMKALYAAAHFEAAMTPETAWVAQSIGIQLQNAVTIAGDDRGPVAEVLQDPERRDRLDHLRLITTSLSALFGKRLAADFGVTAGFSSLDGD